MDEGGNQPGVVAGPQGPGICFATRYSPDPFSPRLRLQLTDSVAESLAALLPVLVCGEESAALAFEHLGRLETAAAARHALARIAAEEHIHETILRSIQAALPADALDQSLVRASRRFFARMADPQPGRHFARIAALDSAVCTLLGALRRRGSAIASEPTLQRLVARLHADEARHVLLAREHARRLGSPAECTNAGDDTRHDLVALLARRADAIEALSIDPDRLFARLLRLPRGLLP